MRLFITRGKLLAVAMLLCIASVSPVHARDGIESTGDALAYLLPAAAGGLTLVYRDGQGTLQFAGSTTLALGSTIALKYTISEDRPNHHDDHSFPSGHSAAAFSSAEFLRLRYGWEYGMPAYALATFVAFSRVHAKQHHVHDVIAGAAIGIGSSYYLTDPYKGWHIQTEFDDAFHGVRLSRRW
jgi:membrane-associated phospholipid phosphatase